MTVAAPAHRICAGCSDPLEPGDRFCASCGMAVAAPEAAPKPRRSQQSQQPDRTMPAVPSDALADVLSSQPVPIESPALLATALPFCRACGADHQPTAAICPECHAPTGLLPARVEGALGSVYTQRRGLRKRRGVWVGSGPTTAKLLLESGEVVEMEIAELPPAVTPPVPEDFAPSIRTPHGALLRLSSATHNGVGKLKWDPDALASAALEHVGDLVTARLVALDALTLGWTGLLDSLPLTASERLWLRAVHAVGHDDVDAAVEAIGSLPPTGYRPKLVMLARVASATRERGADLARLEAQLVPFDDEPLAMLLLRAFGFSDGAADAALSTSRLVSARGVPSELVSDAGPVLETIAGKATEPPSVARLLPRNARLLLASRFARPGLVGPADVAATPLPLLDDLIENGAIDRTVVLGGSTDGEHSHYLRARVASETLTDADVERLGHDDERIRRAFRHAEADVLAAMPDSPTLRHYRALVALRGKRPDPALLEDVLPEARPVVERLLGLVAAKSEGTPLSEVLDDRLVADPTVWPVLVEIAGSTGLAPTPALLERFPAFTEWLSLHQAREYLYLGEWRGAVDAAERCLALAHDEAVCDEALNLKACGLHQLGDDARAIEALEKAIEGAHSEALLANIGVVATGLQPETAARYLGMLMREAPSVDMKVAAARRAVAIWSNSDTESWRNSDQSPLPDAFQDPLHELVIQPIAVDDFRDFMGLLALYDAEWLADERNTAASPHHGSLEARFYIARARDLHELVGVMGEAMAHGSAPEWVLDERDSLRNAAIEILFENLDQPDNTFGSIALAMADENVLASRYDHLLFTGLGIAGVTYHLSDRQSEIGDQLVQRTLDLRHEWQGLEGEDRSRLEPVVEIATRRVAINRMLARDRDLSAAIDAYNSALDLGDGAEYGSPAYFEALRRVRAARDVATTARDDLLPLMPLVDHAGVRDDMNKTIETTRELEAHCLRLLN